MLILPLSLQRPSDQRGAFVGKRAKGRGGDGEDQAAYFAADDAAHHTVGRKLKSDLNFCSKEYWIMLF